MHQPALLFPPQKNHLFLSNIEEGVLSLTQCLINKTHRQVHSIENQIILAPSKFKKAGAQVVCHIYEFRRNLTRKAEDTPAFTKTTE